ncbi:MAG TPA: Hpt domain-containing protein, partial [Gemmatimonadales bacterium]|nr:Hpt domain-containing protein [Gemmatimonadales bacterium]
MSNPLETTDFFALEAGECLDRLESLVDREDPPPPDEFFRAARVLRGSALMAGQQPIARAAAGLEAVARALRDGRRGWEPALREHLSQSVEDFRLLVRRVREWGDGETARATRLGLGLESLAGRAGDAERRTDPGEINTGVRAFVAREGALIASALDRAARALHAAPGDREPLYTVIRRMQSLRGLAELGELVPLPEIMDGIEMAIGDLTRLYAPPPGVDEVMSSAASALTRISRDIAEQGRPDPDAEEA